MLPSRFVLLSLAAAASLANSAFAQGDDCPGALNISNGSSGPYSNAGSTTSVPAWPCGAGGNDVWFSYVAPGTGPLTVDTCGATYDSTLEIFDGTGGCGGLISLVCNDDSCGLQSSVSTNVTIGTTYFIRVGGFVSQTGTFPLNVNGPAGTGTVATVSAYGTGCIRTFTSFYENFAPSAFDLSNSAMTMIFTGTGYTVLTGLTTFVPPSGTATNLGLSDDSETTVPLTGAFPYVGGVATTLTVCSNGFVSVATGNGVSFTPDVGQALGFSQTAWGNWHDFFPTATNNVMFEEIANVAYITWNGVVDFGSAGINTWQLQFDMGTGMVHFVWQTMSLGGNDHIVFYSPAGPSADPSNRDLSATLGGTFQLGSIDSLGLGHSSSARPIIGNTINLVTSNISPAAFFGAVLLSLTQHNPGIDLTGFGMAGCFQYQANDLSLPLFFPLGSPTASTPFTVPNLPGFHLYTQSAVYDPSQGTLLGAVSANALDLSLGIL